MSREQEERLRNRTYAFAVRVKLFCNPLLRHVETYDAGRQLIRASSSVAANYRASCIARSHREFTAKMGGVHEEADESVFWSMHLRDTGTTSPELAGIIDEAQQLARIFNSSYGTARRNEQK